jgi:hypothetical protein
MNPQKEAENIPEEQREDKTAEYLLKTANNLKAVAKKDTNKKAKQAFNQALENVNGNDYAKLANIINQVNNLFNEARQGGDINKIVSKINSLKDAR